MTKEVVTNLFAAPEFYFQDSVDKSYDIWSLGVTLFEMLTLEKPFKNKKSAINIIFNPYLIEDKILRELVQKIFSKKSSKRPNIKEVISTIKKVLRNMGEKRNLYDFSDNQL